MDFYGELATLHAKLAEHQMPTDRKKALYSKYGGMLGSLELADSYPASELHLDLDKWLECAALHGAPQRDHLTLATDDSKWVVLSMLQKAVRRGNKEWAFKAATVLVNAGLTSTLIRRMAVICLEDLGLPGLMLLAVCIRAVEDKDKWYTHELRFDLIWGILELMCECTKDRTCCDLSSVQDHPTPRVVAVREAIAAMSGEELAEVMEDCMAPVVARVLAHRRLAKTAKFASLRWKTYGRMKLPALVYYTTESYKAIWKDNMWTAIPVLWDIAARSTDFEAVADDVAETLPRINGIPSCAFDMFTWAGKRAMMAFKLAHPPLRAFFKSRPELADIPLILGYGLFAAEGGMLSETLQYDDRAENALDTMTDEFGFIGLSIGEAAELVEIISEGMPVLHECRVQQGSRPIIIPG